MLNSRAWKRRLFLYKTGQNEVGERCFTEQMSGVLTVTNNTHKTTKNNTQKTTNNNTHKTTKNSTHKTTNNNTHKTTNNNTLKTTTTIHTRQLQQYTQDILKYNMYKR